MATPLGVYKVFYQYKYFILLLLAALPAACLLPAFLFELFVAFSEERWKRAVYCVDDNDAGPFAAFS